MPTVIDTLVLEFALDPSRFNKGQREAMDGLRKLQEQSLKQGKEIESTGNKIGQFFSSLKTFAVTAFAGYEAKKFIDNITTLDAHIGRVSRTLDVNTEELSAWGGAVEQVGGNLEDARSAISGVVDQVSRLKSGLPVSAEFLSLLNAYLPGINITAIKSTDLIMKLVDAMKAAGLSNEVMATQLRAFPGMTEPMINAVIQGRKHFEGLVDAARQSGVTFKEASDEAEKYQASLALLERSAISLWRILVTALTPALTVIMDIFAALFRGNIDLLGNKGGGKGGTGAAVAAGADELRRQFASGSPSSGLTTITTAGGKRVTVSSQAAGDFQGFLDTLEKYGAPIGSLGGYNNRKIAGTNTWSEHSKGLAVDMGSMTGRDQIDPALRAWINAHPEGWRATLAKYHMRSGGDFKNPDLGHVEWRPSVGAAASLPSAVTSGGGGDTTMTSTTHIGSVNVTVPGGDADSIAKNIAPAIKRNNMAGAFNAGQE